MDKNASTESEERERRKEKEKGESLKAGTMQSLPVPRQAVI